MDFLLLFFSPADALYSSVWLTAKRDLASSPHSLWPKVSTSQKSEHMYTLLMIPNQMKLCLATIPSPKQQEHNFM